MATLRLPHVLRAAAAFLAAIAMLALAGCPAPRSPTGPPPEYEDPPPPSWLDAGAQAPEAGAQAPEAGAPAALVN